MSNNVAAANLESELSTQKLRIERLEKQIESFEKRDDEGRGWPDRLTINGLFEVEFASTNGFNGDAESGIALATVGIGMHADINDWVNASLLFLHEGDAEDSIVVDEGFISFENDNSPYYLKAGSMYVPFGVYETNLVSDPLTLGIGEISESAVQVGINEESYYGALYLFNGSTQDGGDDLIEHFGVNIGMVWASEHTNLDVGLDYISSIGDTNEVQDALDVAATLETLVKYIPGVAVHANYSTGSINVITEYVSATDEFDAAEVAIAGVGAKPSAWSAELAYSFDLNEKEAVVAMAFQGSDDAVDLGLSNSRQLVSLTVALLDNVSLAVEFAMDDDYSIADGGTGDDSNSVAALLAVEF